MIDRTWLKRMTGFGALRVFSILGGLALVSTIVRIGTPEQAGAYFTFTASVLLVSSILTGPLQLLAIRFGAIHRDADDHGAYFTLVLAGVSVIGFCGLLVAAAANLLPDSLTQGLGLGHIGGPLFVVAVILTMLVSFQVGLARADGHVLTSQLPDNIIRPYGVAALVLIGLFVPVLGAISLEVKYVTVVFGSALFLAVLTAGRLRPTVSPEWRAHVGAYSRNYPPLAIRGVAASLLSNLDVLLVTALISISDVASYKIATQVAMMMGTGIIFSNIIYGPQMAVAHAKGDKPALQHAARMSSRTSFVLAAAAMAGIVLFPGLLGIAFGAVGTASYPFVIALGCGRLVNTWFGSLTNLGSMTGNAMAVFWAQIVGVVVLLAGSWLLSSSLGPLGIAIASAAASVCWNLLLAVILGRRLGISTGPI